MPSYLTETLYRFCTPEGYSKYTQNKRAYLWILKHWIDESSGTEIVSRNTFRAALMYMKGGKSPSSIEALRQWIVHNPSNDSKFEKSTIAEEQLQQMAKYEPLKLDDDVLFQSLLNTADTHWIENTCQVGSSIADGSQKVKNPLTKEEESGPAVAVQWMRSRFADRYTAESPNQAGRLDDNTDVIKAELYSRLVPQDNGGRFPLGIEHIDKNVIVGKQNLKFIGVVGMSGDGKTTLTNTICYNWLRAGAHILYVSMEHTPNEIWTTMAFMHQSHPDYNFKLPVVSDWDDGLKTGLVTPQDDINLNQILADVKGRVNLPGILDVQQFREWDAIYDHLLTNHPENKYDILIVDYIGRLTVPGDQKFRDKEIGGLVHRVQGLCQTFDENKGLIVLTPIQVNREGNKRANSADEEAAARYDLNAISTISEYQHDLDLCLSVWSDAEMKLESKVLIEQIKQRKGRKSAREVMYINSLTGAIEYGSLPPVATPKNNWDRTVDDVVATTTSIDADCWPI